MITLIFEIRIILLFQSCVVFDRRDYPEEAVREALLNLLVHREYSFRASSFISIYADRIEFTSIGGLISGMTLQDVMMGNFSMPECKTGKMYFID